MPSEGILALQRREVGDQEARPCRPLDVLLGQRADLAVQVWGRRPERQQTAVGEGDLLRQRLGIAGSTQAGEQPRAIAVVPGATLALDAHLLAAGAQPRVTRPYGSAFRGGAPRF